jgi:hypothetical protein
MSRAHPVARPSNAFVSPTVGGFPSGPMCPRASRLNRTKTIVQANRTTRIARRTLSQPFVIRCVAGRA